MDQPAKLPSRRETKAQVWKTNPEMEKDFIDFCIESAALHGYKGTSLKSWSDVILKLNSKYNQNFDQKALKNKWTYLRHGYTLWRKCCQRTGTGRNEDGTFNWSDEVWEAEIKKDPNIGKFRLEPLKYHNELYSLFEGTFAVGDSQFNPRRGDPVEIPDDAMHVDLENDGGSDHEGQHFVDVENDAYFSRNLRDASPGIQSTREDSPAQGSTPISMRSSGDSQRKGKRKSYEDDFVNISEMLQSHVKTTELDSQMLRKRMDLEEEMLRRKMDQDAEKIAILRGQHGRTSAAGSLEDCCNIIEAMKDISDLDVDEDTYFLAKIAISRDHGLQVAFLSERTPEAKAKFLKIIARQ